MIEAGLLSLLKQSQAFSAVCPPDNIFAVVLPDDPPDPSVTFQLISSTPDYDLTGSTGFETVLFQFDVWSKNYKTVLVVSDAMRQVLENFRGSLPNGIQVCDVRRKTSVDLFEQYAALMRRSTDYKVQFSQ